MSLDKLKQLFAVAALGFVMVGCSSTPTDETQVTSSESSSQTSTGAADGSAVSGSETGAAGMASAEQQAADQAAQMAELFAALQGKRVHFDFDRSEVKPEFYEVIKMNADYLSMNTEAKVTLEGHCDERGSREYNLALGERRANAVKNALIAEGVDPSRIEVISFGEDRPLVAESNSEAWKQNRRAEFVY